MLGKLLRPIRQPQSLEYFAGARLGCRCRTFTPAAVENAERDVFEHGHVAEWPHDLKRARHPPPAYLIWTQTIDPLPGEGDRAVIGAKVAGNDAEQRGFAGTVRTHDAD